MNGARLDSFYSSANVCTAARGGLLTGRYPIRLDLVADVARPTNEIHLAFTGLPNGTGSMTAENHQVAADSATSVVLHERVEGAPKIACADLG